MADGGFSTHFDGIVTPGYLQTSGFTRGSASLLTAAVAAGYPVDVGPTAEYTLWRKANSVFMGDGQAGCEPEALYLAALDLGLTGALYCCSVDLHFDAWNDSPDALAVARLMRREDRRRLQLASQARWYQTYVSHRQVVGCIGRGGSAVVLTREPGLGLHWICLMNDRGAVALHDPFLNGTMGDLETVGPLELLSRRAVADLLLLDRGTEPGQAVILVEPFCQRPFE